MPLLIIACLALAAILAAVAEHDAATLTRLRDEVDRIVHGADPNPMPLRFHLFGNRGAISIEAICLLIIAAIAVAWFFGIHVTAAH